MIPKQFVLLPLALMLIISAACLPISTGGGKGQTGGGRSGGPESLLASAEEAYNKGQYQSAADYYKRYLQAVPNPGGLESILGTYGLSAEKAGRFNDAAGAYERLISQFPGNEFALEARPRLAAVYLAAGDPGRAESFAARELANETNSGRQARLRLVLGQSQWALGRHAEAAGNFLTVWRSTGGQTKSAAEEGALASLARLDSDALEKVQRQYGQNFPGPEATYLLVRQAAQAGDRERTVALADYFGRYFSSHPLLNRVSELVEVSGVKGAAIPPLAFGAAYDPRMIVISAISGQTAPAAMSRLGNIGGGVTVAAILPLSGDNASKYAQQIASGLKLAINTFAPGSVGLTLMDTKGSASEAARLVNQAAADSRVLAVVGPFLSPEALEAAGAANRAGLPLIAISQRTDLPAVGPNVFRLFLTPKHQAEAVARYTVRIQGNQTLGVLYPEDNYGRPLREYFENEARRLGAQITVSESYEPQTADWSALVSRLTGGQVGRKVSSNYQAQTDFTALYLPGSSAAASQILAQMAFHDVTKMQYLGSPLWLNQEFLTSSSRYIQGAVIPAAISELSQRPETRRFITDYQNAYGQAPDQFAAYGYDAGLAIIKTLGQGAATRDAVRRALSQGGAVPGATGPFTFDAKGEYVVDPTILSVKGRNFILLREAGPGAL